MISIYGRMNLFFLLVIRVVVGCLQLRLLRDIHAFAVSIALSSFAHCPGRAYVGMYVVCVLLNYYFCRPELLGNIIQITTEYLSFPGQLRRIWLSCHTIVQPWPYVTPLVSSRLQSSDARTSTGVAPALKSRSSGLACVLR